MPWFFKTLEEQNKEQELQRREEFRKKFPYGEIRGVLGGVAPDPGAHKLPGGATPEMSQQCLRIAKSLDALKHGCLANQFLWQLVNKETGCTEAVKVELSMPNQIVFSALDALDISPVSARHIRPVRELVNRFIPNWFEFHDEKPAPSDFAYAVARTLWGKTFTFRVMGSKNTSQYTSSGYYNFMTVMPHDTLLVWSNEIEYQVMLRMVEFRKELDAVKASFLARKSADNSLLVRGATLRGRIVPMEEGDFFNCEKVELDGVGIYSAKLAAAGRLRLASGSIARKAEEIHVFTVVDIDESTLTAVVSSQEADSLAKEAAREWEELEKRARECESERESKAKAEELSRRLGGAPLFIDGNNVVRCGCNMLGNKQGWRVLKSLLGWLDRNALEHHLFFDASVRYLGSNGHIDEEGVKYIDSLLGNKELTTECPSRDEADSFILFHADKTGCHVISNDGFRQWDSRYPWIHVENNTGAVRRIHKFVVVSGQLSVPDLELFEQC